jgi:hypothetical protein
MEQEKVIANSKNDQKRRKWACLSTILMFQVGKRTLFGQFAVVAIITVILMSFYVRERSSESKEFKMIPALRVVFVPRALQLYNTLPTRGDFFIRLKE